jgi:hypothetical protein
LVIQGYCKGQERAGFLERELRGADHGLYDEAQFFVFHEGALYFPPTKTHRAVVQKSRGRLQSRGAGSTGPGRAAPLDGRRSKTGGKTLGLSAPGRRTLAMREVRSNTVNTGNCGEVFPL